MTYLVKVGPVYALQNEMDPDSKVLNEVLCIFSDFLDTIVKHFLMPMLSEAIANYYCKGKSPLNILSIKYV